MTRLHEFLLFPVIFFGLTVAAFGQHLSPAEKVERSVVMLAHGAPKPENVLGSGFVVSESGLIMTADHVVFDEKTGRIHEPVFAIQSRGSKLHTFQIKVVRRFTLAGDPKRDLALLEPSEPLNEKLVPLKIGGTAKVGDDVIIAGFPLVWEQVKKFPLVRRGSVASTRYESDGAHVLVLDLPSIPGFSGSPVVQSDTGSVVGVLSRAPKKQGSGFSLAYIVNADDLSLRTKRRTNDLA